MAQSSKASRNSNSSNNLNNRFIYYANKYYGTKDLSRLTPYQLDKLTTWASGMNPNKGKNNDNKAGRRKGRYAKNK